MSTSDKGNDAPSAPYPPTQTMPYPTQQAPYPTQQTATYIPQQNESNNYNMAPPPPYFQPLPPMQQPVFLTPVTFQPMVGSSPTRLRCPNCSAEVLTSINHKSGCLTWAICGAICAAGLFVPCAWFGCQFIPFCIDSCKDVVHTCPNCKAYIGTFDRMK